MKPLLKCAIMALMIGTSQASMSHSGNRPYGLDIATKKSSIQIATPSVSVRVTAKGPRIPKPKLFSGKPQRAVIFADDWDYYSLDTDDVITSYRRRDLDRVKSKPTADDPEGDISENIRWKLFLARQAAMIIHKEKWG
jgi:hypothetical protein